MFQGIIRDQPGVTEGVNDGLDEEVVRVTEPAPPAFNADAIAILASFFSRINLWVTLPHRMLLRLGMR